MSGKEKFIVIVPDGMSDEPVAALGGKTPMETAEKPMMDYLASRGMCGYVQNTPDGMAAESDTANMSILGFDPSVYSRGRSALEALAMGKPIVATRVGGNPEVVQHGVNGFIVPPSDASALAEALLRMCREDTFRNSARTVNRTRFETQFGLQPMVKAHEKLMVEVARKHGVFGR